LPAADVKVKTLQEIVLAVLVESSSRLLTLNRRSFGIQTPECRSQNIKIR
jgi:hypothetical protein